MNTKQFPGCVLLTGQLRGRGRELNYEEKQCTDYDQGCALRVIIGAQRESNYKMYGAQQLSYVQNSVLLVTQRQKLVACGTGALLEHSSDDFFVCLLLARTNGLCLVE